MGHAARVNPRSTEGGKPRAYCSFQRCIRAVHTFGEDRAGFVRWLDSTAAGEHQRAAMERIWSELHPAPMVTLADPEMAALTVAAALAGFDVMSMRDTELP